MADMKIMLLGWPLLGKTSATCTEKLLEPAHDESFVKKRRDMVSTPQRTRTSEDFVPQKRRQKQRTPMRQDNGDSVLIIPTSGALFPR
jgi:hypothetical protein